MSELLRAATTLLGGVAFAFLATRRRLVRRLEKANAHDDASATELATPRAFQRWWRSRLESAGVLRAAGGGRYWLDAPAWKRYRDTRRRRALMILALGVFAMAILRLVPSF